MASAPRRNMFFANVDGHEALARVFDDLPKSVQDTALRAAAKKALQPVADTARQIVRKDDGELAQSITISTSLSKRQRRNFKKRKGEVAVYAGPSYPAGAHGHLVEFGTRPRYHKSGKFVGIMPAAPFLRPAWDMLSGQVKEVMAKEIWTEMAKAVRRLRKRAERGKLSKSHTKFFTGG